MRPKKHRESGEHDLFRSRLDQIIDMGHALVKLAGSIDWRFLEERLGAVYIDKPGHPPLPTRLMAGLAILKHMHDLSDVVRCERWWRIRTSSTSAARSSSSIGSCSTAPR
jgi:IS5 family transposase